MPGSPAFEQEKDQLVVFLQAALPPTRNIPLLKAAGSQVQPEHSVEYLSRNWLERRSREIFLAYTTFDVLGRPIPAHQQRPCPHNLHWLEGWSAGSGMIVSCYFCHLSFHWDGAHRRYVSCEIVGPLLAPPAADLQAFLMSSRQFCPDYVGRQLLQDIRRLSGFSTVR